jgi:hypothetical protein
MMGEPSNQPRRCRVCRGSLELLLDLGPQPLCNRYLSQPADNEFTHPFQLGLCQQCGLLQQIEPVAAWELKPAKPVRYTEPEVHLDQVAKLISELPGISKQSRICGITSKDQSTIDRLIARGFGTSHCLRPAEDLGIREPAAGIETIQERISDRTLQRLSDRHGYQVVIARHVFEHAHRPHEFLDELAGLLAPGGYLVLEVPDFTNSLLFGDYSTLWEDHVCYFTQATLSSTLEQIGWSVVQTKTFPYTPEDSLIAVATKQDASAQNPTRATSTKLAEELAIARQYSEQLGKARHRWQNLFVQQRQAGRQTALLGVGHLGVMFINVMNLGSSIDVFADDDPEKVGRYLPGSHQLVQDMNVLYERPITLCLLSVSPEGESCVLERHRQFLDRGGTFKSIFPTSRLAYFPDGSVSASVLDS